MWFLHPVGCILRVPAQPSVNFVTNHTRDHLHTEPENSTKNNLRTITADHVFL